MGGAGGNAVTTMIDRGLIGVEFLSANTDLQALSACAAPNKVQLGERFAGGLGVGCDPERGAKACQESLDCIQQQIQGAEMLFMTAGMGGGTGTGGLPPIAELAREMGILTVAVVTKPFDFEGRRKMSLAEEWIEKLMETCDSVIVVPNQRLLDGYGKLSLPQAFTLANDILLYAVQGITDIVQLSGMWNVDMEDVRMIMKNSGRALMGMGYADGDDRAVKAAEMAITNHLIEDATVEGSTGVLVNVTCNPDDVNLEDFSQAVATITDVASPDAIIKPGLVSTDMPDGQIRITVIATGFDTHHRPTVVEREAEMSHPVIRTRSGTTTPATARASSIPPAQRTRKKLDSRQVALPIADANLLDISDEVTSIPAFIQQLQINKTGAGK
ncbi:MAG: cell division protein FtsZ [Deltaproteobacteria bacterium]|nr:cell division protein FtsZ [Deltaproteobacteria bacterium]